HPIPPPRGNPAPEESLFLSGRSRWHWLRWTSLSSRRIRCYSSSWLASFFALGVRLFTGSITRPACETSLLIPIIKRQELISSRASTSCPWRDKPRHSALTELPRDRVEQCDS